MANKKIIIKKQLKTKSIIISIVITSHFEEDQKPLGYVLRFVKW